MGLGGFRYHCRLNCKEPSEWECIQRAVDGKASSEAALKLFRLQLGGLVMLNQIERLLWLQGRCWYIVQLR